MYVGGALSPARGELDDLVASLVHDSSGPGGSARGRPDLKWLDALLGFITRLPVVTRGRHSARASLTVRAHESQ